MQCESFVINKHLFYSPFIFTPALTSLKLIKNGVHLPEQVPLKFKLRFIPQFFRVLIKNEIGLARKSLKMLQGFLINDIRIFAIQGIIMKTH